MNGSVQLNRYFSARRNGRSMMNAAIEAGIGIGEARLIENDEVRAAATESRKPFAVTELSDPVGKAPPPPEPQPIPAPEPAPQPKEQTMARGKKSDTPISGEVPKPDFELAVSIYRNDIKPAQSKVGEHAQEMSCAFKEIKKHAHIQPQAAKLAFKLDTMEEAKRDDFLRSFKGLLTALNIFMPVDLVDKAQGNGSVGESVVPIGKRAAPKLATIPPAVEGDADLADEDQQHAAE